MCYRFISPDDAEIVGNWPSAVPPLSLQSSRTVYPTQAVPVLYLNHAGSLQLEHLRWGLIPAWWKQPKPPTLTYNARSEEAAQKPSWRTPMKRGRCLMPARSWIEWQIPSDGQGPAGQRKKTAYLFSHPQATLFAFAALMDNWTDPTGTAVHSCALLTRSAPEPLSSIHERMPVVLFPQDCEAWLDPTSRPEVVADLITKSQTDFVFQPMNS